MKPRTIKRSDFVRNGLRRSDDKVTTAHQEIWRFYEGIVGPAGMYRQPSILEQIAHAASSFQVELVLRDAKLLAKDASKRATESWARAAEVRLAELRGHVLA